MRNGDVDIHTCNTLLYELSVCIRMYCTTDNVTLKLWHCVHTVRQNATGQCTVVIGVLHEGCGLVTGCDMSLLLM